MNDHTFGRVLSVRNVNHALPEALDMLLTYGQRVESRGMATIELPGPLMTVYHQPRERFLFDPKRDANPFFHIIDALWLLSGSNKTALPCKFLESLRRFSDDGDTFHGAYGYRLRRRFGCDQIARTVGLLRGKPDTRQAVMSIWDPAIDLGAATKDMPCNDMLMFSIRNDKLNMTVCNRSNDAILGAYGANAVQFSVLQEVMAALIGVEVGKYVQSSNSMHVYEDNAYWRGYRDADLATRCTYESDDPYTVDDAPSMVTGRDDAFALLGDAETLAHMAEVGEPFVDMNARFSSYFFRSSVVPMLKSHMLYRTGNLQSAITMAWNITAWDLRTACLQWLTRRLEKKQQPKEAAL